MQQTASDAADFRAFRTFGRALRHFRKRARQTQAELGRAVGYSREYIAQLEGDRRNPDPSAVAALFIPALELTHAQAASSHLLELAVASRGETLQDYSIRIQHPAARDEHEANPMDQTLSWYIEMDPEAALRLANALEPMWMARNDYREARAWFSAILARSTSETVTRAEALLHAGRFAHRQGDACEAKRLAEEALRIYRRDGDPRGMCAALIALGWALVDLGQDFPRANAGFRESLSLALDAGEPQLMMEALVAIIHVSAPVTSAPADWPTIEADMNACEQLAQQLDDMRCLAFVSIERGFLEIARGNLAQALQHHLASQRLFLQLQDAYESAWAAMAIGEVLWHMRDLGEAREHLKRGLKIFQRGGQRLGCAIAHHHLAQVDRCKGLLVSAERHYTKGLSYSQSASNANMVARCVAGLAAVALACGNHNRAARLLAWAQAQFDALPPFLSRYDIDDYRRIADEARAALGKAAFQQQWRAGQAATLDSLLNSPA